MRISSFVERLKIGIPNKVVGFHPGVCNIMFWCNDMSAGGYELVLYMGGSEYVSLVIADAINSFVVVAVVNIFYICVVSCDFYYY